MRAPFALEQARRGNEQALKQPLLPCTSARFVTILFSLAALTLPKQSWADR
jgi:hypothetical protein